MRLADCSEDGISIVDNPIGFNARIKMCLGIVGVYLLLEKSKDRRQVFAKTLCGTELACYDKTRLNWSLM